MKGKLLVIEGTDGSGKGTQTTLLAKALQKKGYAVEIVEFPQYGKPSAAMVEEYLNGRLGTSASVNSYQASLLYAVDRFGMKDTLHQWLNEGKIVLCNRYVTANMGHQAGKISDPKKRSAFLTWVKDLEYTILDLPQPDHVLFLRMKPTIGQQLVLKKEARAYIAGKKKDIHEADITHLQNAFNAFSDVAKLEKWKIIECDDGKKPYPIEEIHAEIMKVVSPLLEKR